MSNKIFSSRYDKPSRTEQNMKRIEDFLSKSEDMKRFSTMDGNDLFYTWHEIQEELYKFLYDSEILRYFKEVHGVSYNLSATNHRVEFIDLEYEEKHAGKSFRDYQSRFKRLGQNS